MSGTIDIEDRIAQLFDSSDIAWWEMELPSGAVFFHPNKARMFGGRPRDFVHVSSFTSRLSKRDQASRTKALDDHIAGKTSDYSVTFRVKDGKGHYKLLYDKGRIVHRDKDGTIKVMGFIVDVTKSGLTRKNKLLR